MIKLIKTFFWKSIKSLCFCLYPLIFIYFRFIKHSFDAVCGEYCKNQIKNRGQDLRIHGFGTFTDCDEINIGNYCRIGKNAYFHACGGLIIGNNVQMSRNVTISAALTLSFKSVEVIPYDNTEIKNRVIIQDNVWIGMNVSILPGVTIGKNAIIGMGAIITKDVPNNAIVVGNNRLIGFRANVSSNVKLFGQEYPNA